MSDNRITGGVRTFKPVAADKRKKQSSGTTNKPATTAIEAGSGKLASATDAALELIGSEPNPFKAIYQQERGLVQVFPDKGRRRKPNGSGVEIPAGTLMVYPRDADAIRGYLAKHATWYRVKLDKKGEPVNVTIDPPVDIARNVIASRPWDGVPYLHGIIQAPTIDPHTGRIIQTPGYDKSTELLFEPGATEFPRIPDNPSKDDARKALARLNGVFEHFPFVRDEGEKEGNEAARSVALCAVLTAMVRKGLDIAPMFCFDAPTPGSGKTLLAEIPSLIATNLKPLLVSQVTDPESERKRLLGVLLSGPESVVIDNIERPLQSATLCTILTSSEFTDRVLGSSNNTTVSTNVMFCATGNNLVLRGDLTGRTLMCRIDPAIERPEERTFSVDLRKWIPQHRGELAAAALTIIKAYLAAECPNVGVPPFREYRQWQRLCQFPLIWLGCTDPMKSREGIVANDPERETLRVLLEAWDKHFKNTATLVADAIKTSNKTDNVSQELTNTDLRAALAAIGQDGKDGLNPRKIGNYIRKFKDRIEGSRRFVAGHKEHQALTWKVETSPSQSPKKETETGELGELGEFAPYSTREKNDNDFIWNSGKQTPLAPLTPRPSNHEPEESCSKTAISQEHPCSLGATPSVKVPARGDELVLVDCKGGRTRCCFVEVRDASVWRVALLEDCTVLAKRAGDVANVAVRDLHMPSNQPAGAL